MDWLAPQFGILPRMCQQFGQYIMDTVLECQHLRTLAMTLHAYTYTLLSLHGSQRCSLHKVLNVQYSQLSVDASVRWCNHLALEGQRAIVLYCSRYTLGQLSEDTTHRASLCLAATLGTMTTCTVCAMASARSARSAPLTLNASFQRATTDTAIGKTLWSSTIAITLYTATHSP